MFCWPKNAFALDAPAQISPSNNQTTTSSTLSWQVPSYILYSSNPYRVQVDNNSDLSSPEKDYYTTNTTYTPSLTTNTWYWRVRARDQTGTSSDWSSIWAFTLTDSDSSPSPSPSSISTPNPTPTPSSSTPSTTFTISSTPSSINSDVSFAATVNLSIPSHLSTSFYIKGAFAKSGSTNYFGYTKIGSDWVKNSSPYSSQKQITTDSSGNWSGNVEVKPDSEDSGFTGTGSYIFKIGYYRLSSTGASVTGPIWSNEITLIINQTSNAPATGGSSSSPTPTPSQPSTTQSSPPTSNLTANKTIIKLSAPKNIASIAGVSTQSMILAQNSSTNSLKASTLPTTPNWYIISGSGLIAAAAVLSGVRFYKVKYATNLKKLKKH